MAYSALVRCAAASGLNLDNVPQEALSLAWYCVQLLLDTIKAGTRRAEGKDKKDNPDRLDKEQLHRLHLTLISTVSSLPLILMFQVLEEMKIIITSIPTSPPPSSPASTPSPRGSDSTRSLEEGMRNELVKALFDELMKHVGYREKNAAMQWWYQNRMTLEHGSQASASGKQEEDGIVASASSTPSMS